MPIREFCCKTCHHRFEVFLLPKEEKKGIVCPNCGGKKLTQLFSVFGVTGGEKKVIASSKSCAKCSTKSCSSCS